MWKWRWYVGIASSAASIKICVVSAEMKKYKSIIKKKVETRYNSVASKN